MTLPSTGNTFLLAEQCSPGVGQEQGAWPRRAWVGAAALAEPVK